MKYILSIIALFGLLFSAAAQSWTSGSLTNGVNLLSSSAYSIVTIQLTDTSGSANVVTLYDNDSATSTNRAIAAYTGRLSYTTNEVLSFTDLQGVARTVTNTTLKVVDVSVSAATNEARRVWRYSLPANGSVTFAPVNPLGTSFGLSVHASGAGAYNLYGKTLP